MIQKRGTTINAEIAERAETLDATPQRGAAMTPQQAIRICYESPDSDEAQGLIRQLDADLLQRYPALLQICRLS